MNKKGASSRSAEITARVQYCRQEGLGIQGLPLMADPWTAFVEFYISHSFPVVTTDGTAIHPQVVANSFRSMRWKVFNLAHLMRSYNPAENPRDRILGTVIGVEFPESDGPWKVQSNVSAAPGIRAVACMHRAAEQVEQILAGYFDGRMPWTVSMENHFYIDDSGFLVRDTLSTRLSTWREKTPPDLSELGWVYVPAVEAPEDLMACLDAKESKIIDKWLGQEVVLLIGGLNGPVQYSGVGLTPLGKEPTAEVSKMLASGIAFADVDGQVLPKVLSPLFATAKLFL
jgi:hypothetical protein